MSASAVELGVSEGCREKKDIERAVVHPGYSMRTLLSPSADVLAFTNMRMHADAIVHVCVHVHACCVCRTPHVPSHATVLTCQRFCTSVLRARKHHARMCRYEYNGDYDMALIELATPSKLSPVQLYEGGELGFNDCHALK